MGFCYVDAIIYCFTGCNKRPCKLPLQGKQYAPLRRADVLGDWAGFSPRGAISSTVVDGEGVMEAACHKAQRAGT